MARVWEKSRQAGSHLLMLLAIADFSDDDGNAYPAVQTLAQKCRMKPRNANVIMAALRASGELEVRQNEGPRGTNLYRIVLDGKPLQEITGVQRNAGVQRLAPSPAKACSKPLQGLTDEPSVNHQEPSSSREAKKPHRSKSVDSVPECFDEFWIAYDKKVGRANSIKEWKLIKPDAALSQLIVTAAKSYSSAREQKYRKDPERWLKGRMWEDEAPSAGAGSKPDWLKGSI